MTTWHGLRVSCLLLVAAQCGGIAGRTTTKAAGNLSADESLAEAATPAHADAENPHTAGWHFVRGPNFDGHSSERRLADSWPEQGPPVLWTRTLGQGYSSFVAWNGRIATQYQTLGGQFVVCLSADTGETLWRHRYDWPYEAAGVYPGPRATPTYDRGRLYYAGPSGLIGCLDAGKGRVLWQVNLDEQFGTAGTGFGYSCSPTVVDGKVVLPVGGRGASLVALDAVTGSVVWQAGNDAASYTPAYPITFQGRRLVLGYLQNALVCHDLESGKLVWRRESSAGYDEHAAWPIYSEPFLWVSSAFRAGSELLKLEDPDQPPRTVWKAAVMSNDIFSSVLIDGALYGFDVHDLQAKVHRPTRGQFRCLDFLTGEEHWSTGSPALRRDTRPSVPDAGQRIGHATVLVADDKLFLFNDTGELILARVTKQQYEELDRVSVLGGEICWTQPTLYGGRLIVRNQTRAACLFVGAPQLLTPQARATALTTADIPQTAYVDLAAAILGVEPEAAFDIPDNGWLLRWYLISLLGVLGISQLAAFTAQLALYPKLPASSTRWLFWVIAFLVGAAGTTVISRWQGSFIFTWPVSLFIAFQAAVFEVRVEARAPESGWVRWRARFVAAAFVVCCLGYFLLCRRLSLVFEWVFLCGFAGALPFALASSLCFQGWRWQFVWQVLMTAAGFTAFYWSAVAILWLKA